MSAFHIAADCIGRKRTSHFIDTQRTELTGAPSFGGRAKMFERAPADGASGLSERLGPSPPRRIEAVVAGMVKTYDITRRINEPSLTPQPLFIAWLLRKL